MFGTLQFRQNDREPVPGVSGYARCFRERLRNANADIFDDSAPMILTISMKAVQILNTEQNQQKRTLFRSGPIQCGYVSFIVQKTCQRVMLGQKKFRSRNWRFSASLLVNVWYKTITTITVNMSNNETNAV